MERGTRVGKWVRRIKTLISISSKTKKHLTDARKHENLYLKTVSARRIIKDLSIDIQI